ncbi:FISUMP domain-containing protein [Bacteroidota bacterium]
MKNKISIYVIYLLLLNLVLGACSKENLPPHIRFSVIPAEGDVESIFFFDARKTSDDFDSRSMLKSRWDFDGDGVWDTDYSSEMVQQYKYDYPGNYTVHVQVKDSKGLVSDLSRVIKVFDNGPLYPPSIIFPEDGSENIDLINYLRWSCFHSDNLKITYDIYLGKNQNPPIFNIDYISNVLNPGWLESGEKYYWRVVAKDEIGNVSSSPIYSFSTKLIDERDGKGYDIVEIGDLLWMAENLNFQPLSGSWCFNDKLENCMKFGSLYNWMTARKSCPKGWHLPSDNEWRILEMSLLMTDADNWGPRGDIQGEQIKKGGSSGFNALMGGTRDMEGNYSILNTDAGFWTSTGSESSAYYRWIFYQQSFIYRSTISGKYALSVRCVKNS